MRLDEFRRGAAERACSCGMCAGPDGAHGGQEPGRAPESAGQEVSG